MSDPIPSKCALETCSNPVDDEAGQVYCSPECELLHEKWKKLEKRGVFTITEIETGRRFDRPTYACAVCGQPHSPGGPEYCGYKRGKCKYYNALQESKL